MDEESERLRDCDDPQALEPALVRLVQTPQRRCVIQLNVDELTARDRPPNLGDQPTLELFAARLVSAMCFGFAHFKNGQQSLEEFFLQGTFTIRTTWDDFTGCLILHERHHRIFTATANKYRLHSAVDQNDLLQDVRLRVLEKLMTYQARGPFDAWLWKIANRRASQLKRFCRDDSLPDSISGALEDHDDPPEVQSEQQEEANHAQIIFNQLRSYNEVVYRFFRTVALRERSLKDWLQLSETQPEIAVQLQIAFSDIFPRAELHIAGEPNAENQLRRLHNAIWFCLAERINPQPPPKRDPLPAGYQGAVRALHQLLDKAGGRLAN